MSSSTTTRMPRAQRRSQLLNLATRVFTERGYHGTSMDDIAGAAGVTKPVLYQHFSSKETLYVEVIDIIADELLAGVRAIGDFEGETTGRVRYGLERFFHLVSVQNSLRLFTGNEAISDAVHERAAKVLDEMAVQLADVLMASRRMSPTQSRVIGRGLLADTQTTALLLDTATDDAEREEILQVMTSYMVHGLTGFDPLENPQIGGSVLGADGTARTGADG